MLSSLQGLTIVDSHAHFTDSHRPWSVSKDSREFYAVDLIVLDQNGKRHKLSFSTFLNLLCVKMDGVSLGGDCPDNTEIEMQISPSICEMSPVTATLSAVEQAMISACQKDIDLKKAPKESSSGSSNSVSSNSSAIEISNGSGNSSRTPSPLKRSYSEENADEEKIFKSNGEYTSPKRFKKTELATTPQIASVHISLNNKNDFDPDEDVDDKDPKRRKLLEEENNPAQNVEAQHAETLAGEEQEEEEQEEEEEEEDFENIRKKKVKKEKVAGAGAAAVARRSVVPLDAASARAAMVARLKKANK